MRPSPLRLVGIFLILLGVGTVAFLTVTAWMGNSAAGRAQDRLSAEFQQSLAAVTTTTEGQEDDPRIVAAVAPATTTITTTPGDDIAGPEIRPATPALISELPPDPGSPLGRIVIPDAGVDWVVVEGVTLADLAQGPGHMPGTAVPGQPGNAVISGHRTTNGAPFHDLDLLEPGDRIIVETLIGTHVYAVAEVVVVAPTDVWVTKQVDGGWLTLTTCHPKGSSRERLIVFARLIDGPNSGALPPATTPPRPG